MRRKSDAAIPATPEAVLSPGWAPGAGLVELFVVLAVFATAACWPVPDVNETAYLTKARHHADPAWAEGDFFLETPEAHGVFYVLLGPVAAALPLEQAAWLGRWLGWLAVAWGFCRAVGPLLATPWQRVIAAAMFSLALRHTTAAGEWVLGGCESKVFAWALVLAAIGEIARCRLPRAVLALGAATALHPLVGGWGMILLALSEAFLPRWISPGKPCRGASEPRMSALMIGGGLALAAVGLVPVLGLSGGADETTRAAAARIYVVERLPHHLLVRTFADGFVARHVLAILLWAILVALAPFAMHSMEEARARAWRFAAVAIVVSLIGCCISLVEPFAPSAAYGLLRFYWFRMADVLVPFSLAVAAAAVAGDKALLERLVPGRSALVRATLVLLLCVDLLNETRHWPWPGRTVGARSDGKVDAESWRDACVWVSAHTPPDACILTPRGAASLTWRTGRREVVGWKNSPQDAASLVAWRQRIVDCFSRDGGFANLERSTATLGADRMRQVARAYGATHAIVPADLAAAADLPFERLYANRGYVVQRLNLE